MPSSHILANCIKGRILARRSQLGLASAAFEAAVEQAKSLGLWLLEAFALRDLKLCVLDVIDHSDHGSRRLGAALRQLVGPADKLTPLLNGLDASELMALEAPEPGYAVVYEAEDPAQAELRKQYQELRVMSLHERAP